MAIFEKLRISLQRQEPGQMLDYIGHAENVRSRSEYLTKAFLEERYFIHGRVEKRMKFVPIKMPVGFVGGFFARERPVVLRRDDLAPYEAENFEGALVIVSTAQDQNAWVQRNRQLAAPKPLMESYFSFLLKKTPLNDYKALVKPVDFEQEYWAIIKEKKEEIGFLSFTFIPPNALDADDAIYQLIKQIQGEANPDTQKHSYRAPEGQMNPNSPHLEASARIAMAGGGDAEVRTGSGRLLYSSNWARARVTDKVPDDEMPTPDHPSFVARVIKRLFEK